jgi:hypothetical protein
MKKKWTLETGEQLIIDVDDETLRKFETGFPVVPELAIISRVMETIERMVKEAESHEES